LKNDLKLTAQCHAEFGPGPQSPRVAACHAWLDERLVGPRPGGPVQPRSGYRPHAIARVGGVVTTRNPRAGRCGGALAEGPVVAIRWQGVTGELVGTTGTAPGNESGGGARRGRRSTARRRGRLRTAAFRWRVALAIIDECGEVLQLEGDNGGEEMAVDGGDRRLEEALTDEWWMAARFGRNPMRASILRSSAVDRRWGGVSGELVRPGKRRENGEKEGGHGGGGDHFKSARRGGGRPAGWRHVAGEGRERGERGGGGNCAGWQREREGEWAARR
jgi:hypothetical protein